MDNYLLFFLFLAGLLITSIIFLLYWELSQPEGEPEDYILED